MKAPLPPEVSDRGDAWRIRPRGFTLIELLVAVTIFSLILLVIFGLTQQASNAWRSTSSKIEAFQDARAAFDTINEKLSQATLNTYYDYLDASGNSRNAALAAGNTANFIPASYGRYSDLHFISGKSLVLSQAGHALFFQTPAGYSASQSYGQMDTLLNACGFYVGFEKDPSRPAFLDDLANSPPDRYRYRLFQMLQPSEKLSVYASGTGNTWVQNALSDPANRTQLAQNVIALVILPKASAEDATTPIADQFEYDSRDKSKPASFNQLPPLVEVVMVAIDENSARRLDSGSSAPDFGVSALFKQASSLDSDLKTLEGQLSDKRINYRIFRTTVPLRGAKWSSQ